MPKINAQIATLFKQWLRSALNAIEETKDDKLRLEDALQSIWKSLQAWEIIANQSNDLVARANIRGARKSIHLMITTRLKVNPDSHPEWRIH